MVNCLGVDHMEEEVQDRVQVEVGREEQGVGETHGKEQSEPHNMDDHECGVMCTNTFLSHDVSVRHSVCALCKRKITCEVYLSTLPVGYSRLPSAVSETTATNKK